MGSMGRPKSAHMAGLKGKGIMVEDDDSPIKLTTQDDSDALKERRMSLIGKVLVPKKQNVVKLLQTMPGLWGLQDRITANDLGNGKFLFNFANEEDLQHVLSQGPFHYNFFMFVLVRWELIVHDDYPWVIPFWVQFIGIPLHLWNIKNLEKIGARLGKVDADKIELIEGRMLIEVDSKRPLKFKRQVESPEGDEVTIAIQYEKLFKHCSTCGLMTHEKGLCLTLEARTYIQSRRGDVFSRVQLAPVKEDHQAPVKTRIHKPLLVNEHNREVTKDAGRSYARYQPTHSSYESYKRHGADAYDSRHRGGRDYDHRYRIIRGRDKCVEDN